MAEDQLLKGVDVFIQVPTDGTNVDIRSTEDGFLSLVVTTQALVQMLESGLPTSLYEDIRMGCSDIPSEA